MGFMVLEPNNDRGHQIDVIPEKGQEYQAVHIFGKDRLTKPTPASPSVFFTLLGHADAKPLNLI
jgi:hypothetical protein